MNGKHKIFIFERKSVDAFVLGIVKMLRLELNYICVTNRLACWRNEEWRMGKRITVSLAFKYVSFDVSFVASRKRNDVNHKCLRVFFFSFIFSVLGIPQTRLMSSWYECSYLKGKYHLKFVDFSCLSFN